MNLPAFPAQEKLLPLNAKKECNEKQIREKGARKKRED